MGKLFYLEVIFEWIIVSLLPKTIHSDSYQYLENDGKTHDETQIEFYIG